MAACWDLAPLALVLATQTAAARLFGFPSGDYLRFGAAFFVFLLPGWCLTRARVAGGGSITGRLPLALLVSYTLYGALALTCRALSLGYLSFGASFAVAATAAVLVWIRGLRAQGTGNSSRPRAEDLAVVLAVVVLSAAMFALPYSEDQGIFDFNVLGSLETRSFAPSALDATPFGVAEVQPRMEANLHHAYFAVVGWAIDVSPRALLYYVAPPFFGAFLFLALAAFVRAVTGPAIGRALAVLAVIAPWSLFYRGLSPYWYEFRVLNSPTLDKDFANLFLLPILLALAWRYLIGGRPRHLGAMVAALPATIWTHPVAPVYLFIGAGVLSLAACTRDRMKRCAAVCACTLAALLVCQFAIDPARTHDAIEDLVRLDALSGRKHFWGGHYVAKGDSADSSVVYCCGGETPVFRPSQFFGSGLVHHSMVFGLAWALLLLASPVARVRAPPDPPDERWRGRVLVAASLACVSAAALFVEAAGDAIGVAGFATGAVGASLALALLVRSGWHTPEQRVEPAGESLPFEEDAARVQIAYAASLVLAYVFASLLLGREIALYRGLERLHWFYLGFFPFAFLGFYVLRAIEALARLGPRATVALPTAFLVLHAADQAHAIHVERSPLLSRAGIGRSAVDELVGERSLAVRTYTARAIFDGDDGRGAGVALTPPPWLRDGDVVLYLAPSYFHFRPDVHRYAIQKQAVYYRELYSEAFALERLGPSFLTSFHAYNDAIDVRMSSLLLTWLRRREVTVIVTQNPAFVRVLQESWPAQIESIGENAYRIADARPVS